MILALAMKRGSDGTLVGYRQAAWPGNQQGAPATVVQTRPARAPAHSLQHLLIIFTHLAMDMQAFIAHLPC